MYAVTLTKLEVKEAKEKKRMIYRIPPPPNKIKPRALRRSKVKIIYPCNERVFAGVCP